MWPLLSTPTLNLQSLPEGQTRMGSGRGKKQTQHGLPGLTSSKGLVMAPVL